MLVFKNFSIQYFSFSSTEIDLFRKLQMQQELATQITFYLGQTINLSLPTFFFLPYFKIIESTFYRQEQTF